MRCGLLVVFALIGLLVPAAASAQTPKKVDKQIEATSATAAADVAARPQTPAERYRQARDAYEANAPDAYALASSLPPLPGADDRRLALLARTAQRAGKFDAALEALATLERAATTPTERYRAKLERAELLATLGRHDEAQRLVQQLAKDKPGGRRADRRFFESRRLRLQHDLHVAKGEASKARSVARQLLLTYPTEAATLRDGLKTAADDLSVDDRFRYGKALYDAWDYDGARREFERVRDHAKHGREARWFLAQIALNKLRDDPKQAEELFAGVAKTGPHAAEALYQLARAQMRQERYDDALATMDAYVKKYPRGEHVQVIQYYRGWLPYDHRHNDRAIEGFKAYVARYGKRSRYSSYVFGFWAWAHMRQGQWKEAISVWEELRSYGNSLVEGKALYWQAYAHERLGERERALGRLDLLRERYSLTYYHILGEQLRAQLEGRDPSASKVWWPEGGGRADDSPRKAIDELPVGKLNKRQRETWARVRALVELDEREHAREALGDIYDAILKVVPARERDLWIHALGYYVGDYHRMWRVATGGSISAMPRAPDPEKLHTVMAYPRAYRDVVLATTGEFELPPELMWSIMRQESRYKPGAVSHTDAVGALQMIPSTARLVAADLGITYDVRTFFRPEVGFRYSAYYMRKLLDTFEGLFVPMCTAYNSGPSVVARWFRRNPDVQFAWLIEEFEYNEGRNYGRKVAEHMLRYLYLYEPDATRRGQILDRMFPLSRDITLPDDVGY